MGICAEICADNYQFSREEQDSYAIRSYERGIAAKNSGAFSWEIAPVKISRNRGKQSTSIDRDDGLEKFDPAKLKKLPPSFKKNGGSVTAGNAPLISDGAAALVLVSGETAKKLGTPCDCKGSKVLLMQLRHLNGLLLLQPLQSLKLFQMLVWSLLKLTSMRSMKPSLLLLLLIRNFWGLIQPIEKEKVNVHGGAVSLGHPLGCSGARVLVTLLGVLRQNRGRYGVAGICNGGGGASALALELIWPGNGHSRL